MFNPPPDPHRVWKVFFRGLVSCAWETTKTPSSKPRIAYASSRRVFDYAVRRTELDEIEQKMLQAGFWNDQEKAQLVVAQKKKCVVVVQPIEELEQLLEDTQVMLELAEEDPGSVEEDLEELGRRIGEMLD